MKHLFDYCSASLSDGPLKAEALTDLRVILRRDWDVRVLDAWLLTPRGALVTWGDCGYSTELPVTLTLVVGGTTERKRYHGATSDAARHAAALAVFPTLTDAKRAELGECP